MAYSSVQKITNTGGAADYYFGYSVDIYGYYALVGEEGSNICYLYKRDRDGEWENISILNPTISANAGTGCSVAMEKNYAVLGAHTANGNIGSVAVYYDSGSDSWSSYTLLVGSDSVANDYFGTSVDISNEYLVVGSPYHNNSKGAVYVFKRVNANEWEEHTKLVPFSQSANDYFGISVSIDGNTVIVGSSGDNQNMGAAYVFVMDEDTEVWSQQKKVFASDGERGDQFGCSVSVSGDYFVVGAKSKTSTGGAYFAGAVYIYKYNSIWYQTDKLEGNGESSYTGNNFGSSVYLNGDYLIIGSPEARQQGVADIYYKKRGWNHVKKIESTDTLINDDFGASVAISYPYLIVGSPYEDTIDSNAGCIYLYEDPSITLRLAQEFSVEKEFVPSKASVYLKRVGSNSGNYWRISNEYDNTIDATNFSSMTTGNNKIYMNDVVSGFTGNGYMILQDNIYLSSNVIQYPVRAIEDDTFTLWIRCISLQSSVFKADILLDNNLSRTIDVEISDPSVLEWSWVSTKLVLPDTEEHILGIRIKEKQNAIDKLYITVDDTVPYADGPLCSASPYITVHMKVYTSSHGEPLDPLMIYDYKNTITHITQDDWYNFDIRIMDSSYGYTTAEEFDGTYFLVMSCSGVGYDNFITWEMVDNNEYQSLPSAIRI